MLVGVGDAPVMLFLEGVFSQLRLGVFHVSKMFNKLIAFLVRAELQIRGALRFGRFVLLLLGSFALGSR